MLILLNHMFYQKLQYSFHSSFLGNNIAIPYPAPPPPLQARSSLQAHSSPNQYQYN